MSGKSGTRSGISRPLVSDGCALRVRRLRGEESERYRAPSGETFVAVVELAVALPLAHVEGREDELADLRTAEASGPEGALRFLDRWRR